MKRGNAILLSSALLASLLCGCGQAAPSAPVGGSASSTVSSGAAGTSGSVGVLDAAPAAPTAEPAAAGQPISLLFSKATGVSREWQDGKFIINGLDASGNKICGIADSSGNAVLVDGYTALYPLADGHLLATTEADASGECNYTGRTLEFNSIGFAGVILDENLNVVYQPDASQGYERLYPINSHLILAIRAKTSFEGKTADLRVLDQNGHLLYNCDKESINWAGCMRFDDTASSWTFSTYETMGFLMPVSFGADDALGENHIIRMDMRNGQSGFICCMVFGSDSYTCEYHNESEYLRKSYSAIFKPYNSTTLVSGGFFHDLNTETIANLSWETYPQGAVDLSGINNVQSSLPSTSVYNTLSFIGSDNNGTGYFVSTVYQNEYTVEGVKHAIFVADGRQLEIPSTYMDVCEKWWLLNDKILLSLSGGDGLTYYTLADTATGSCIEPFHITNSPRCALQINSVLATGDNGYVNFYNIENGQELGWFELTNLTVNELFACNDYLIAGCSDESDFTSYHIYSLTDNMPIL